jgi:hypothetical protein
MPGFGVPESLPARLRIREPVGLLLSSALAGARHGAAGLGLEGLPAPGVSADHGRERLVQEKRVSARWRPAAGLPAVLVGVVRLPGAANRAAELAAVAGAELAAIGLAVVAPVGPAAVGLAVVAAVGPAAVGLAVVAPVGPAVAKLKAVAAGGLGTGLTAI